MKVLEVMERVGSRDVKKIVTYLKDGLLELQSYTPEKVERATIPVVSGTRLYSLPSNMVRLLGVYQNNTDGTDNKYIRIANVISHDIIQDASATEVSADADIIII